MRIVEKSRVEITVEYFLEFDILDPDRPGRGAAFPCTESGEVLPLEYEAGRKNLEECLAGKSSDGFVVRPAGVRRRERRYRHPRVGLCECGTRVGLGNFTNTCRACGRDYNSSGSLLASRSQWGEETGETADEILRAEAAGFPE